MWAAVIQNYVSEIQRDSSILDERSSIKKIPS